MKRIRQARDKRDRNDEYARRFPVKDKARRRKARRQRVAQRDARWLATHTSEGGA